MALQTPHDALFRQTFANTEQAASLLRAALPPSIRARADWSTLALHEGTLFGTELAERETDLLFSFALDGALAYVWVLLEHQSSSDHFMALRLLEYILLVWRRLLRDEPERKSLPVVIPLVVHHGERGWSAPTSLWDLVEPEHRALDDIDRLVPSLDFLLLDLVKTTDEALARDVDSARGQLVLAALKHAAYEGPHAQWLEAWVAVAAHLITTDRGLPAVRVVIRYLLEVTDTPAEHIRTVLSSALQARDVERVMSTAEKLRQQGREEGLAEGRGEGLEEGLARGLRQGQANQLLRLLSLRFGPALTPHLAARIQLAPIADLDRWADRILTAETLDDIFA